VLEEIFAVSARIRADMASGLTAGQVEEFRQMLRQIRINLIAMRPDCAKGSAMA